MTTELSAFLAQKGFQLQRMNRDHDVDFFDCGRDEKMSSWFSNKALKWQAEDMCAAWVISPMSSSNDALGFFTLSSHQIVPSTIARNDKATDASNRPWVNALGQPYPAQLLGKFALDRSQQGTGLGQLLMLCAYAKHLETASITGAKFLVLDVREPKLISYYRDKFGFVRSSRSGELAQMYRPTAAIRSDVAAALE